MVGKLQARRRYRRMARALAELDRVDRLHGLGAPVAVAPRPRRRIDPTAGVAIVVVLAFLVLAAVARMGPVAGSAAPARDVPTAAELAAAGYPPLPADASFRRLLPEVAAAGDGEHAFIATAADGDPVGFDPCRPVHYVVNPDGMPEGGLALLRDAVAQISAATGLVFVDDGFTTERISPDREMVQPQRYGPRWAPVLIAWPDDQGLAFAGTELAGVASPYDVAPSGPGSERYVTGFVGLNSGWFGAALADPETAPVARGVALHELGHLVGLDHVADPAQVMNETSATTGLAPGDREGLAAVGAGECHSDT
jgi:Na+-transporting methylmalonyl-CoA/oxaloacetate decarboxylase gamma subunit